MSTSEITPGWQQGPTTRAAMVTGELRRMIQVGELVPGSRLRQAEIAKAFGVSTTPVREAFTALALEGLVRQDAHRGALVFEYNLADLRENYEIRIELEPLAAGIAAKNLGPEHLAKLDRTVQAMREAETASEYHHFNREFHATIYSAAQRPRLLGFIESLRDASEIYYMRLNADRTPDDPYVEQVHREHEAIAAALSDRQVGKVKRLLREHLEHNVRRLEEFFAEQDG